MEELLFSRWFYQSSHGCTRLGIVEWQRFRLVSGGETGRCVFSASRNAKRQDCRDRTVLLMAHIHCSYVVLQMTKISTAYVISAMCVRVWKPQKSKHIYLVLHPVCHHPSFFRSFFVFFYHPRTAGLDEETEAIDVAANDLGILGTQGLQALPGMATQSCKCYLGKPMEINGNP